MFSTTMKLPKFNSVFTLLATVSFLSTLFLATSASQAQAGETFSVDPNMALNTNNLFRKIDGQPRMSMWQRNDSDPDQIFERLPGNRGGILLRHQSTGKCINVYRAAEGREVNVFPCNANDPEQNFVVTGLGDGTNLIRRAGTNLCIDAPTRTNGGRIILWTCDRNNPNQRWRSNSVGGNAGNQREAFFTWANGQYSIARLDRSDLRGECVSLVVRYLQQVFLGGSNARRAYGHGKDVAAGVARQHPDLFTPLTRDGLPQRGAIISFPGPNTEHGHVGIVMDSRYLGRIRQVQIMESNADGRAPNTSVRIGNWINIDGRNAYVVNGWTNPR